jgi:hypothetical protein
MAGHIAFWIVATVIGLFCFSRAWRNGAGGLDDQGNINKTGMIKFPITEAWVAEGAGLLVLAFVDFFFLFNPPPASMDGGLSR